MHHFLQLSGIMHLLSQFNDFSWYYAPNTTILHLFLIISKYSPSLKIQYLFSLVLCTKLSIIPETSWYYAPCFTIQSLFLGIMHHLLQINIYFQDSKSFTLLLCNSRIIYLTVLSTSNLYIYISHDLNQFHALAGIMHLFSIQ